MPVRIAYVRVFLYLCTIFYENLNMNKVCYKNFKVRIQLLISVLFACVSMYGVGFTPSEGGLVVDLKTNDRFLLSVWIDLNGDGKEAEDWSEEFFVCDYTDYTGGRFKYTSGHTLKLIPQSPTATEPSETSIWTVKDTLARAATKYLGGVPGTYYTMWSQAGYTLYLDGKFKTQGKLHTKTDDYAADVVFVVPTGRATASFDPNNTMGRGTKFSAEKGIGFLGMPYREVYWLDIPKGNSPSSYTNASVVGFNTTLASFDYAIDGSKKETAKPGQALYSFADNKHKPTPRTIFRLYVLDEKTVSSCPESNYYFAYSQRFWASYRKDEAATPTYTKKASFLTMDRLHCMDSIPGTTYYQTDWMTVPELDSCRYYVGYKNHFARTTGENIAPFNAQYTFFEELPLQHMPGLKAPKGAFGRMMADTTKTGEYNLGVFFRPAGVFLKVSTGRNVQMHPEPGDTSWISNEMWHVTEQYAGYTYKATLYSGPEFSATDPGFDIAGWSVEQKGDTVPVVGGGDIVGQDGWCRVYVNKNKHNGGLEFVPADASKWVKYNNNGHFGDTIETAYPMLGKTKVVLQEDRLLSDYDFRGWNTDPDSTKGTRYQPGDTVDLSSVPGGQVTLYAIAVYRGDIRVAISFMQDGKRYFLTHPGVAPRFAHARTFDDWTNTWQGMANVDNVDPEYMSTYLIVGNNTICAECADGEYVLDPKRETMHGAEDSVTFYENFRPETEEYIGLYYTDPNTILANNTWAGLFKSSKGWPEPTHPCIENTKLSSTHYLHRVAGEITRDERPNSAKSFIKYVPAEGTFNGVATSGEATDFTLSGVGVVDEHYIVLPDTSRSDQLWTDQIVFDLHSGKHISKQVWSKLIGKQLMMQMQLGDKIVYFHPNNAKTFNTANQLWLSRDYRLTQSFEFIRDARVESLGTVSDEDRPHMTESTDDFCRMVNSGLNSPVDLIYNGEFIDIVDTIRVTLHTGESRIKEYFGIWKDGAPGLHVLPNGSRYRDILVITKTYHHGPVVEKLKLTAEQPRYIYPPMYDVSHRINFTLSKVRVRELHDKDDNVFGEEILSTVDETSSLHIVTSNCSFTGGDTYFAVTEAVDSRVVVKTKIENTTVEDYDTLVVRTTGQVDGVDFDEECRVPLMQTAMELEEVVWSVFGNGKRYYIMAGSGGLIFRQYELKGNTLYKKSDGVTQLIEGSADAANSDTRYITPWDFTMHESLEKTAKFFTNYGVNKNFIINGSGDPDLSDISGGAAAAWLTYEYVTENFNDNGNFEEVVKIKYGADKWLKFTATEGSQTLSLTTNSAEASTFSWTYLKPEMYLLNNGDYPSRDHLEFGYNKTTISSVTTRYKAYRIYSMLVGGQLTYCGRLEEADIADLIDADQDWKTNYTINHIHDSRFAADSSHLSISTDPVTLTTTVTPSGDSPLGTRYPAGTGPFVNIVDTLDVQISLQTGAHHYGFKDQWSDFTSVDDAHLKIPLVRRCYHEAAYDSILCTVDRDEYTYVFPPEPTELTNTHTFTLHTVQHKGTHILNTEGSAVAYTNTHDDDHTSSMHLNNPALAEIRLIDEFGNSPDWCEISSIGDHTVTVHCKGDGMRSPRSASMYLAYTLQVHGEWRYVNFRIHVMQASRFQYAGNQHLVHSEGASGDPLKDGVQQVHEHRNIVYYYNPSNAAQSTDQRVELPIRERNFYGWWRWYSLEDGKEDTDIPTEKWQTQPMNAGKYIFPYRTIGDSVWIDEADHSKGKKLVTQGRYTVFHVPSNDYGSTGRKDPPSKAPMVYPPQNKAVVTYALDLSVYYDNLPLSMTNVNQVDTAIMDTLQQIIEPTLSLREIYELHPWTEMAERMENYKDTIASETRNLRYLEDHTVMAPTGAALLLTTEQRYNYDNVKKNLHSESVMGYYMRDDNWATWSDNAARQDSMIWCAGWDVTAGWYTYNPRTKTYTECTHTVTEANDFLSVPSKYAMPTGREADTVIYCLRARSVNSTFSSAAADATVTENKNGNYWFNICRYTIIYHRPEKYGPKLEDASGKALITNDEIEQSFEVLERLNFDYNKPGEEYTVYPHPLPWADASYGFAYPMTDALPDNRFHNKMGLTNLANMGEYNLINRIPDFGKFWHKMEQHGGAENGYMIFCDGMSSAGQVAALHLDTTLCEGQKMYFSGYVANPGNEKGKSCPNFLFSVQGSRNNRDWYDITEYMTGELPQSSKWRQIFFPIEQSEEYTNFRVRVYNMASNDDGNDFIIDDMCIFATKPPLMVYQANTTCKSGNENDSLTHIVLRVDYQGFPKELDELGYQYYTIQEITKSKDTTFVELEDGYYNEDRTHGDTICGKIDLPARHFTPRLGVDSIFPNLKNLIEAFEISMKRHEATPAIPVLREGYVYEHLDDSIRPVLYVVHSAKMNAQNTYIARMAGAFDQLMSSDCGLTRALKVRNRMILTLNGEEQPEKEVTAMCANTLYDVSLLVKGTLLLDSVAPIEVTGSCYNDWLLYGDTANVSSLARYGYKYSDIAAVISILRADDTYGTNNTNHFAQSLVDVNANIMRKVQEELGTELSVDVEPYVILKHLVDNGFLTLYKSDMKIVTPSDSAVRYTIFPIPGTGSEVLTDLNVDVCPTPIHIRLQSSFGSGAPLIIGGLNRPEDELQYPVDVLANVQAANTSFAIPIDSLMLDSETGKQKVAIHQIRFLSTNDPHYRPGLDTIVLEPDRTWSLVGGENTGYYQNGNDTLVVVPALASTYSMREGYYYSFGIEMMTSSGESGWAGVGDCPVGIVPFNLHVVPTYLRWDPQTADNRWNNPDNWIGVQHDNTPIHEVARYAPLQSCYVVIPPMTDGKPYPVLPATISSEDSIQKVGFQYNVCHSIRFLPGGAMSQQQRLAYDSVIADLSTPYNKWALRSSPVEGLLSGDIFMSNADLTWETPTWAVGPFDAAGRTHSTGNASFWLSLYSTDVTHQDNTPAVETWTTTAATWSKVTNAITLPLKPAQGWAVFTRTHSGENAAVRLPKNDDIYYYYTKSGNKVLDLYESGLRAKRAESAGGADKAGKMAFYPGKAATSKSYTLSNGTAASNFVFGNPTLGYIDIWGFIADNTLLLDAEIGYMNALGEYTTITQAALTEPEAITSLSRYLPPMQAIMLKKKGDAATSISVTLNTNRIVTDAAQITRPLPVDPDPDPAPARRSAMTNDQLPIEKGIMTVTAVNPASPRCVSRLLLGQGFNDEILRGEDALLTTLNIDNYTATSMPSTPFNIYAIEGTNGLCIDLRSEIVNVPLSFYNNSDLPFDTISYLWFTGVNAIDGELVLYDALTDTERPIMDGIYHEIETPEVSHEIRYFIRRPGFNPNDPGEDQPITTGVDQTVNDTSEIYKFIKDGHVLILRDGHVYTVFGQKIR